MSTHDIELPPLPVPRTKTDGGIELFAEYSVREYARAAIEPYKQRIEELEAQLEAVGAGGVSSQRITSQRRGEPYNPRKPTEEEWRRLTENGRRAWGNHPAVPEKEPPCDT